MSSTRNPQRARRRRARHQVEASACRRAALGTHGAPVVAEILDNDFALRPGVYAVRSPLVELPLYAGLGVLSGFVALLFERAVEASRGLFSKGADGGGRGGGPLADVPPFFRPALGGLICGLIGTAFPQNLFFGYSTLDAILASGAAASASTSVAETSDALSTLPAALSSTNLPIFENVKGFEGSGSTGDNVVAAADLSRCLERS